MTSHFLRRLRRSAAATGVYTGAAAHLHLIAFDPIIRSVGCSTVNGASFTFDMEAGRGGRNGEHAMTRDFVQRGVIPVMALRGGIHNSIVIATVFRLR